MRKGYIGVGVLYPAIIHHVLWRVSNVFKVKLYLIERSVGWIGTARKDDRSHNHICCVRSWGGGKMRYYRERPYAYEQQHATGDQGNEQPVPSRARLLLR